MAKTHTKKSERANGGVTAADGASITEDEFGHYRIKAGRLNGNFIARAFPKPNSKSRGLMAEAGGASEEEAISALKAVLSEREAERTAARRWESRSEISVPTREEFSDALGQTSLSAAQFAMLKAHAIAGENGLTIISLMNAGGYRTKETAQKVFSRAGALFADFLRVEISELAESTPNGTLRIIGFHQDRDEAADAPPLFVMHEELRTAVRAAL